MVCNLVSFWMELYILIAYCSFGLRECSIINDTYDILNVIMAASAGVIVYLAYQNKKKSISRFLYLAPVAAIFVALYVLYSESFVF